MVGNLTYFCFQTTIRGTAANTHVFGIVNGLRELGWKVRLHRVRYSSRLLDPPVYRRIAEFARIQLAALCPPWRLGIVYIRTHFASFPLALFCKLLGLKVVQELNGPYEDNFIAWPALRRIRPVVEFVIRKQIRWAKAMVTVTPQLQKWILRERGKGGVYVIPNAADTELFKPTPNRSFSLPDQYVLFFGALARWQGIIELTSAVNTAEWPPAVSLLIAGYGALEQFVRETAEGNARIRFLGKVAHDLLPQLITGSLCVAVPMNNLGKRSATGLSPLKLYEALACGVPVVVTDFPGQADLVRSFACGLVIPPGDPTAIAAAVRRLQREGEMRAAMGRRGREAVLKHHSWQERAQTTAAILSKL